MKYSNQITIDVPRDRMTELLDDADNMKHWQQGLVNYAFLKGEPGQVGSTMQDECTWGFIHFCSRQK